MILTILRINTQATSKELKKLVMKRHQAYFFVYLLFLAYFYSDDWVNAALKTKHAKSILYSFQDFLLIGGFFQATIRLSEPFVWINFKESMCCFKNDK